MKRIDYSLIALRSLQGFVALIAVVIVGICLFAGLFTFALKKGPIKVTENIYKIPETSLLLRVIDPYPRGLAIIMITDSKDPEGCFYDVNYEFVMSSNNSTDDILYRNNSGVVEFFRRHLFDSEEIKLIEIADDEALTSEDIHRLAIKKSSVTYIQDMVQYEIQSVSVKQHSTRIDKYGNFVDHLPLWKNPSETVGRLQRK